MKTMMEFPMQHMKMQQMNYRNVSTAFLNIIFTPVGGF